MFSRARRTLIDILVSYCDPQVFAAVCRAKLEEALERMDRVVLAMESDTVHASAYTTDLAVQLTGNEAAESVSPALQQVSHVQAE